MGKRVSRVVTRTGDDGSTALGDGTRIGKTSPRVHAIGDVDELNSFLGVVVEQVADEDIRTILTTIQHVLFDLGGELSLPGQALIEEGDIARLEEWLEHYNGSLPHLEEFILPGGTPAAAFCHCARAVCRRAERQVAALAAAEPGLNPLTPVYLNRLSDLLFVVARVLARQAGGDEVYWKKELRR